MVKWLKDLGHSLTGIYNLLPSVWTKFLQFKDNTLNLINDVETLLSNVNAVVQDIRNFDINPKWNSRVISAPKAVSHIKDLYEIPSRIINDVKDLMSILKEKLRPMDVNVEDAEGLDGLPGKLAKGGEKILGWATLLIDSLIAIESAIHDLNDIVEALRQTLEDLNGLDALFLSQSSTKKTVDKHYRSRIKS